MGSQSQKGGFPPEEGVSPPRRGLYLKPPDTPPPSSLTGLAQQAQLLCDPLLPPFQGILSHLGHFGVHHPHHFPPSYSRPAAVASEPTAARVKGPQRKSRQKGTLLCLLDVASSPLSSIWRSRPERPTELPSEGQGTWHPASFLLDPEGHLCVPFKGR